MSQPFFSVVIPAFNREAFLNKCISSVLKQSYGDLEVVVIDDGSTDATKELVSGFKDKRIKYLYQDNHGVAHARNRGLEISKGKFIAFLDSDDWWSDEKLQRAVQYINEYPEIKIFHTEEIWYRKGQLLEQMAKHAKPDGLVYESALPLCCISISTVVIDRSVFDDVGCFDESMEACEDYDFWLRATSKYEVKLIPEALTLKDGGRPDQLSSSVWGLDRFRIRALEKMILSGRLQEKYYRSTLRELEKKCSIFAAGCEKRGKDKEAELYRCISQKYK